MTKKNPGRPKSEQLKTEVISTRLEPEWQAVWQAFLDACDPPTTEAAAARQAIKQYLTARGLAPKKEGK